MKVTFRKGEMVRIKRLKDIKDRTSGPGFVYEMRQHTGQLAKIVAIYESQYGRGITACGWNWKYDWIEKLGFAKDGFLSDKDFEI